MNVITLTGSEKQIAWATDIRSALADFIDAAVREAEAEIADAPKDCAAAVRLSIAAVVDCPLASFWIEKFADLARKVTESRATLEGEAADAKSKLNRQYAKRFLADGHAMILEAIERHHAGWR